MSLWAISIITYIGLQMFSFQQIESFNSNITNSYSQTSAKKMTSAISPRGNFLLYYGPKRINLYDLNKKTQIPISINTTFTKVTFSLDQRQLIFSNLIGISAYEYTNQTITPIILENKANNITDFQINKENTILYYLNQSSLGSLNLQNLTFINNGTSTQNCNALKMQYDFNTQTIITVGSKAKQNVCLVCKWNITNNLFTKLKTQNLNLCSANEIHIFGKQVAITKFLWNMNSMNTYVLDLDSMNTITQTSQQSNNNPGYIVPYHNYYLQYFFLSDKIFVYRDNFLEQPFMIQFPLLLSFQYSPQKDTFYFISKKSNQPLTNIYTTKLKFDCSLANNTIYNSSNPISSNCVCQNGMVFNKSQLQCQNATCGGQKNPCSCSKGNTFNYFNLQCQLSCSEISNAMNVHKYGDPPRCLCYSPFVWNDTSNDCSGIKCLLLNHTESNNISNRCSCLTGYVWNDGYKSCTQKSQESSQKTPIIIIDFQNESILNYSEYPGQFIPTTNFTDNTTTNTTNLHSESQSSGGSPAGLIIGLMMLLLLLIGSVIYLYYRRCKRNGSSPENQEENQGRQLEPSPTERHFDTKEKNQHIPDVQSNEYLQSVDANHISPNSTPKKSENIDPVPENLQDIQNFSIDEEDEGGKQHYFSQIESNIENPLN